MSADPFEIRSGSDAVGGMTIEIGRGPRSMHGRTPTIEISDAAYCFIEPVLARVAPTYHPDTRYGISEFDAGTWRRAALELQALEQRLAAGDGLSNSDIVWIPTVDLDADVETTAEDFMRQMDDQQKRQSPRTFLTSITAWIEVSLEGETVLTVYGY